MSNNLNIDNISNNNIIIKKNNFPIFLKKLINENNINFTTKCNHLFHKICIDKWVKINNSCPTCRTPNIYINEKKKFILDNNYYSRNKYFNDNINNIFI